MGKKWKGFGFRHILYRWKSLTIMWYQCGKGEKRGKGKVIRKESSKVRWHRVKKVSLFYPFSILIIFFRLVWYSLDMVRSDKILEVVLCGLFWKWQQILIVCGIFCNACIWLEWLGKNWRCVWALSCERKERFDRHLFWLIVCVRRFFFFFLDFVGFRRCNVCCNLCMG